MQDSTAVTVVVASHGRPLRLRWLLNALEDQTLASALWSAIVVHDYDAPTTDRVLRRHPLHESGRLRELAVAPGTGSPAHQRNVGWRTASTPLVAFVDDDCRPEPEWLARLVAVAQRAPGWVVQGATRPDPLEGAVLAAPHVKTMLIDPVGPYAQTCNILYSRELLETLDGFDEMAITGEDVDLSLRARAAGAAIIAAPDAIVNHAVEAYSLLGIIRQNIKWRHLAYLVKRHPELRADLPLRLFWDQEHLWTGLALAGLIGGSHRRGLRGLAIPYILRAARRRGPSPRETAVAVVEIPGQAVRQAAEVLGLAVGSMRYRTLLF